MTGLDRASWVAIWVRRWGKTMSQELLFSKYDVFDVIHGRPNAIEKTVQTIPANKLLNASEHDLTQALVNEFRLDLPRIQVDGLYIANSGETHVDVSGDPMRMFIDRSQPFYVPGTKVVIAIPFEGDAGFFDVKAHKFTTSPPRGEIVDNEIRLTYVRTDHDGEAIKQEYQRTLASIKEHLDWLSESVVPFNDGLEQVVMKQILARKNRLLADAGMTASIGLPMEKREGVPATYAVPMQRRVPRIEHIEVTGTFAPEPILANRGLRGDPQHC